MAFSLASLTPARARADTYSGPEVVSLAHQTVDVMRLHQLVLKTQMDRDEVAGFFSDVIGRYQFARFAGADGQSYAGTLGRVSGNVGFGGGHPYSEGAWMTGYSLDIAVVDVNGGYQARDIDGLVYVGGAYHGFEATAGLQFRSGWQGLDTQNRFLIGSGNPAASGGSGMFRPGAPPALVQSRTPQIAKDPTPTAAGIVSIHHAEGVSLGTVFGNLEQIGPDGVASQKTGITAVRALLQPERLLRRADLRKLGAPLLGFDALAPEIDYYGDRYAATRDALNTGAKAPLRPTLPTYEIPFGVDDLASLGIHVRAVTQVSPTPLFRLIQLGWVTRTEHLDLAARALTFKRGDRFTPSLEAFAAYGGKWGLVGLSYSYNVPDSSTFFPVPNASVIGLQFAFGARWMARPMVPLVTSALGDEGRNRREREPSRPTPSEDE